MATGLAGAGADVLFAAGVVEPMPGGDVGAAGAGITRGAEANAGCGAGAGAAAGLTAGVALGFALGGFAGAIAPGVS